MKSLNHVFWNDCDDDDISGGGGDDDKDDNGHALV